MTLSKSFLTYGLCAGLGVAAALAFPKLQDAVSGLSFGSEPLAVLNLNRVVEANEAELTARRLTGDALTAEARAFAHHLQQQIGVLQKECRCTLLVSSAVVGPHELPDLTETLLAKLNLSSQKTDQNLQRVSDALMLNP